jgi:hypothetical protein
MKNQELSKLCPKSFYNKVLSNKNKKFPIILEIDIGEIDFVFKKDNVLMLDKQKYKSSKKEFIKKSESIIKNVKTKLEEMGINNIDYIEEIGQIYIDADYNQIININKIKDIKYITELI